MGPTIYNRNNTTTSSPLGQNNQARYPKASARVGLRIENAAHFPFKYSAICDSVVLEVEDVLGSYFPVLGDGFVAGGEAPRFRRRCVGFLIPVILDFVGLICLMADQGWPTGQLKPGICGVKT